MTETNEQRACAAFNQLLDQTHLNFERATERADALVEAFDALGLAVPRSLAIRLSDLGPIYDVGALREVPGVGPKRFEGLVDALAQMDLRDEEDSTDGPTTSSRVAKINLREAQAAAAERAQERRAAPALEADALTLALEAAEAIADELDPPDDEELDGALSLTLCEADGRDIDTVESVGELASEPASVDVAELEALRDEAAPEDADEAKSAAVDEATEVDDGDPLEAAPEASEADEAELEPAEAELEPAEAELEPAEAPQDAAPQAAPRAEKPSPEATERLLRQHAAAAAAVGLLPAPLLDLALITGIQLNMLRALSARYEVAFSDQLGRSLIGALIGSGAPMAWSSALKAIPGVGWLIGGVGAPAFAGASTLALGRVFAQHFESGGDLLSLDPAAARARFEEERGRRA